MNRAGRTVYPILLMVCATHLLNDMMQSVIPAVYPLLKEKFGFTFAQIGLITLVFQLTSSLLQPVAGRLADLHPRPYSLAAGMCFTLCGLLALAAAPGFALILVSVGLIGCGSSVFHAETSARGIEIGVLVCNAGVLLFGPLAAAPPERIGRIVTLHCTTPALLCRLYGEEMRRRGEGYILVMSSATAWMPYPTIAAYAATKSFLRTFARSLNFEFRKYGVRVTGVFPGAVDTPLYDLDAACRRRLLRWGVMSAPQEVAQHGLRALFRGRSSCIPGVFTKICVCVCRLVPAWLMRCVLRIPAVARLF